MLLGNICNYFIVSVLNIYYSIEIKYSFQFIFNYTNLINLFCQAFSFEISK